MKINVEGLINEIPKLTKYLNEFTKYLNEKIVAEKIAKKEVLEKDDITESWEKLKNNIRKPAIEALKVRKMTI